MGADEGTGDGAGLLMQVPDEFFRAVTDFELPAPGQYVVGTAFLPAEQRESDAAKAGIEGLAADEGLTVLGWREVPIVADLVGAMARACMPYFSQPFFASSTGETARAQRARFPRLADPQARPEQVRRVLPVAVLPDHRLQGHAHHGAAGAVLPGPLGQALQDQARDRPLALLHQHVPVLAPGPAVPHHRAQRRDQHGQGQPQLDARPAVPARQPAAGGLARKSCTRSAPRAPRTRPPSTRSPNCSGSPAGPSRTRS